MRVECISLPVWQARKIRNSRIESLRRATSAEDPKAVAERAENMSIE